MTADGRAVSEVGETGLLKLLGTRLTRPPEGQIWSGDDAAVVGAPTGRLVLTTDAIVEDVDFTLDTFSPADIGWKALAVNVSDVAAMGAAPAYALATILLRRDVPVELFDGVADGLFEAAEAFEFHVVGGDISEAGELAVAVTVVGSASEHAVRRDGAQAGDALCVTGCLGGAAGGLIALETQVDAPGLIERQRRPKPRVADGRAIAESGATAMIDISDGLVVDLERILEASGVGCDVDVDKLPVDPGLDAVDVDATELALTGGEDFELLFTVPNPASVAGVDVTQIGVITGGEATIGGRPLSEWRDKTWDHLRDR